MEEIDTMKDEDILQKLNDFEEVVKIKSKKVKKIKEIDNKDEDIDISSMFTDKNERKLAKELLNKYLKDYVIETISDKNTLIQLVYLEILHTYRLQTLINSTYKDTLAIPLQLVDTLHKNINQITMLKEKLGLSKGKKEEAQSEPFKALQLLKKKFKQWRENNQGSRTIICPHCAKLILLKIRTDAWEAIGHPFFKDRILGNEHLIRLYKEGTIKKEDVAKVLCVSDDYIDWLCKRWKVKIEPIESISMIEDSNSFPVEEQTKTIIEEEPIDNKDN